MLSHDPQIEHCLEQICGQGCKTVYLIIREMQNGHHPPCAAALSALQQNVLLHELQAVMAVYNAANTCTL